MKKLTAASIALCMATLVGCSSSDEEELVLPEIVNQFETNVVWQESIGDGVEHYFSRLTPAVYKDRVFVASRNGEVEALSLENGDTIWETDIRENSSFWPWESDISAKLSSVQSMVIYSPLTAKQVKLFGAKKCQVKYSQNQLRAMALYSLT